MTDTETDFIRWANDYCPHPDLEPACRMAWKASHRKYADTIEQQSKLLDQALEALESVPAWDRLGYANMKVERSITAIKQFKEQK